MVPFILMSFSNLEARTNMEAAEFCLQAKDFSGCMELMDKKSLGNDQNQDSFKNSTSLEELNKKIKNDRKDIVSLLARSKVKYLNFGKKIAENHNKLEKNLIGVILIGQ